MSPFSFDNKLFMVCFPLSWEFEGIATCKLNNVLYVAFLHPFTVAVF